MSAPLGLLCEYVGSQVLGKTNSKDLKIKNSIRGCLEIIFHVFKFLYIHWILFSKNNKDDKSIKAKF